MVYADFESILIPIGLIQKMHMHKPNSAWCYVVCTFTSSTTELYEFVCESCGMYLLDTLNI
jgi:hypothetical protein